MTLIETKLFPGGGTLRPVSRPRLDPPRTVASGQCTVSSIVAPAGYGKSTLLARWLMVLREQGLPCGWLTLDEDDNDPSRFLRYLVGALQNVMPGLGADALAQLENTPTAPPRVILESIAADLHRLDCRAALFLDDLHFIHDAEVLKIIEWLVNYAPRQLQFVLGSREESRLRLGRLRLSGALYEISQHTLTFDVDEAQRFYQSRLGDELPTTQLLQLLEKTEGWPAGLELAALALQHAPDRQALIAAFAGSDQTVMDYLGDVVLSHLDEDTRRFVFQIAPFDRVCGALAREVTGRMDAESRMLQLHSRNLFLIALDRRSEWFRFHQLVREFFQQRYRQLDPGDYARTLALGSQWFYAHGHVEDAINTALLARDWDRASRWLAEVIEETSHRRGFHQSVLRWINTIPEPWLDRYPIVRIHHAFSLAFSPRQEEAALQVSKLKRMRERLQHEAASTPEQIDKLDCAIELQQALFFAVQDEGRQARDAARAWLARWPQASGVQRGTVCNVLSFGHRSCGEIDEGLAAIRRAKEQLVFDNGYYGLSWSYALEGMLHFKRGSYDEVRLACDSGLELVQRHLMGHRSQTSMYEVLLAGVAYERDDLDAAMRYIESGVVNVEEWGIADWLNLAFLTQSRLQRARGDVEGGYAVLNQGQDVALRRKLHRVLLSLAAEECVWLCRDQRFDEAAALARRHGFEGDPREKRTELQHDKCLRAGSRLLLRDQPQRVVQWLGKELARTRERGLIRRSAELLVLQTCAARHAGQWSVAEESLRQALTLAAGQGYRRLLLDEAIDLAPIAKRLETALRGDAALSELNALLLRHASPAKPPSLSRHGDAALIEELTKRELNILRQLDSGLSNREIAESLFISEGTLKWHLHNIYGKLGIKNRPGALAKARGLGLL